MVTVAVAFLIVMACALLILGRSAWRLVRGKDELVAAGSFGRQFFGRRAKAKKPEDWLDR